jgi:UDP-N-acetylmuramyl pentapeptide phosphotransferase/UDP-N-acetylglucosamine-1-phosphate transferase
VFVLVVMGTTNAVNLTDGLDGLAAGVSIMVLAAYGLVAFWAVPALVRGHRAGRLQLQRLAVLLRGAGPAGGGDAGRSRDPRLRAVTG